MANSPHSATGSTVPCSLATVKDTLRCSAATHFWLASPLSRKLHPNSSGSALALQIHQVKQQDLSPCPFLCKTGALRDCEQSCIFSLWELGWDLFALTLKGFMKPLITASSYSFPSHLKPSEPEISKPPRDPKLVHKSQLCSVIFFLSKQILGVHCCLFFSEDKPIEETRLIPASRYWNKIFMLSLLSSLPQKF